MSAPWSARFSEGRQIREQLRHRIRPLRVARAGWSPPQSRGLERLQCPRSFPHARALFESRGFLQLVAEVKRLHRRDSLSILTVAISRCDSQRNRSFLTAIVAGLGDSSATRFLMETLHPSRSTPERVVAIYGLGLTGTDDAFKTLGDLLRTTETLIPAPQAGSARTSSTMPSFRCRRLGASKGRAREGRPFRWRRERPRNRLCTWRRVARW